MHAQPNQSPPTNPPTQRNDRTAEINQHNKTPKPRSTWTITIHPSAALLHAENDCRTNARTNTHAPSNMISALATTAADRWGGKCASANANAAANVNRRPITCCVHREDGTSCANVFSWSFCTIARTHGQAVTALWVLTDRGPFRKNRATKKSKAHTRSERANNRLCLRVRACMRVCVCVCAYLRLLRQHVYVGNPRVA